MNCIEIKHTDFTEEILLGDYYSYYCIGHKKQYSKDDIEIAFIGIDFDRKISENRSNILLVDYQKASNTYINTNIPFGYCSPFQVSHIRPSDVRCFFKVNDKTNEFIKECILDNSKDLYYFFNKYLELLSE